MLMKRLRPSEYGFVEFSRQKVRIYPTQTPDFFYDVICRMQRSGF